MTKANTQIILVAAAAALVVGIVMGFWDDLAAHWRAAPSPIGFQGPGGFAGGQGGGAGRGQAAARVDPPDFAFVPSFGTDAKSNTELLTHYAKQIPLDKTPTLEDWQNLMSGMPRDVPGSAPLTLPLGQNHFVMALCKDLSGNLWIGTEGEGVFRYNPTKKAAEQWAQFTTKDGLGDDYGYALACDDQNRIWVGHLNHGVSVFNGEKWQTYEVVGGLSRPDTLNGPLGERIFKIAVCPYGKDGATGGRGDAAIFHDSLSDKDYTMSGSVWMASSAGLAIYFPKEDAWAYVTRAEGLPSDQANAIAFDNAGTVYIGTQCDGIAIAKAGDHYQSWRQVTAAHSTPHAVSTTPEDFAVPTEGKGSGIPTDLMNDILVTKDQTVYAATTLGLAWSTDHGDSWQFIRGADWIDKVKNRLGGPPQGWQPPTDADKGGGILAEDYCTALAEDADGRLLVGHRAVAGDILERQVQNAVPANVADGAAGAASGAGVTSATGALKKTDALPNEYITGFGFLGIGKMAVAGSYGQGIATYNSQEAALPGPPTGSLEVGSAPEPSGQVPPTIGVLTAIVASSLSSGPEALPSPLFRGEDWTTEGDWVGKFGRKAAMLSAMQAPMDHLISPDWTDYGFSVSLQYATAQDGARSWLESRVSTELRSLYDPELGVRRQASIDDHGEAYPATQEGPGLAVTVKVGEGLHRVGCYVVNERGRTDYGRNRDYLLEMARAGTDRELQPVARSRAQWTWNGVYKEFVVAGPGTYVLKLSRNYSYNTIFSGVFVDLYMGDGFSIPRPEFLPWMADVEVGPSPIHKLPSKLDAMRDELVSSAGRNPMNVYSDRMLNLYLFRRGILDEAPHALLANWKWNLAIEDNQDRMEFESEMALAWRHMQERNPTLADKAVRPFSPGVR